MKRSLAFILAMLMAFSALAVIPVSADYRSGDWGYTVSYGEATINRYYGSSTTVTIPDKINGYPVTALSCWEDDYYYYSIFDDIDVISVSIPDSVTEIGLCAFSYCTSLTSVAIPDSVDTIDDYAFSDCTSLKTVYYGGSETDWNWIYIGDDNYYLTYATIVFNSYTLDDPTPIPSPYNPITITAGDVTVNSGAKAVVPLMVYNPNDLGLCSITVSVRARGCVIDSIESKVGGQFFTGDPDESCGMMWEDINTGVFAQEFLFAAVHISIPSSMSVGDTITVEVIVSDNPDNYLSFDEADGDTVGYGAVGVNGTVTIASPECNPDAGDVNGDGSINAKDVTTLMKELVGKYVSYYDSFSADVNADNTINAKDVTKLMKYLVGDKLTTITASTCTTKGRGKLVCTNCGSSKYVDLPLKAHTKGSGKVTKAATCTAAGERTYYCTVCGQVVEREKIPATGHKWDGGKVTTKATETKEGVKTYTCTVCGKTKTEAIPKLVPAWKTAYRDYAWSMVEKYGLYTAKFALVDLNSDGTPEMYVAGGGYYPDVICTYAGGSVKVLDYFFQRDASLYYTPGGNLFVLDMYYFHKVIVSLYSVSSSGFVYKGGGGIDYTSGYAYDPLWNGVHVSESKFYENAEKCKKGMVQFNKSSAVWYVDFCMYSLEIPL